VVAMKFRCSVITRHVDSLGEATVYREKTLLELQWGRKQEVPTSEVGNGSSVGMVLMPGDVDLHQYCYLKYEANSDCFVMHVSGFLLLEMDIECRL